jgi:hypothetical protein
MKTADTLIACARQLIGVRFTHQGRTTEGLDCLGLLLVAASNAGITVDGLPLDTLDVPHYGMRPDAQLLRQKLDNYLIPVAPHALHVGDVVLLKVDGLPQHLALLTDYPMQGELGMIHAYAPARAVVEHRYDAHWRKQTYLAYRLPGISGA